jgi:hypothetical protein
MDDDLLVLGVGFRHEQRNKITTLPVVIPAKAGIQCS